MFEAARWAPSCFNEQPWRFIAATSLEKETYGRILDCLAEKNRIWASQAPVLILSAASRFFSLNGKENRHAFHDTGLATENLILQGMHLGIFCHVMAGFSAARARESFAIPEGFDPVAAIAAGYPGPADTLPYDLRKSETAKRERKALASLVFSGTWGNPR